MDEPLFKITESKTAGAIRWSKRALTAEARVAVLDQAVRSIAIQTWEEAGFNWEKCRLCKVRVCDAEKLRHHSTCVLSYQSGKDESDA